MRVGRAVILRLLPIFFSAKLYADPVVLVVRLDQLKTVQQVAPAGVPLMVELHNMLPKGDYVTSLVVSEQEIPAIDLSGVKPVTQEATEKKGGKGPGGGPCFGDAKSALDAALKDLNDAQDEKAVATAVGKLSNIPECKLQAAPVIATTVYRFDQVQL